MAWYFSFGVKNDSFSPAFPFRRAFLADEALPLTIEYALPLSQVSFLRISFQGVDDQYSLFHDVPLKSLPYDVFDMFSSNG